mmetsp:Transcript_75911/g.138863  ORF Transcript_75911/g.138863 Transcript_75911/m.138863 type:complete len:322 (+) Transcript_75911:34-999(+)
MHKTTLLLACLSCSVPLAKLERFPDSRLRGDVNEDRILKPLSVLAELLLALDSASAYRAGPGFHGKVHQHGAVLSSMAIRGRIGENPNMFFFGGKKKRPEKEIMAELRGALFNVQERAEKLGVQFPYYRLLRCGEAGKGNSETVWEVREYQEMMVVETNYTLRGQGFRKLGDYTQGDNSLELVMPITAPIMMTPVQPPGRVKNMRFMLPNPHTPFDPADELVPAPNASGQWADQMEVKIIPKSTYVVGKLRENAVDIAVLRMRDVLVGAMEEEGIKLGRGARGINLVTAQYSEIFSLPWNLDNEVWLPLDPDQTIPPAETD